MLEFILGQNLTIKSAELSLFLGLLGEDKFEHQYLARIEDWDMFSELEAQYSI